MTSNRRSLIYSSSPAVPPPSPVPTAGGSRSASNSVLSDYIDKAVRVPQLALPHHVRRLEEISYRMIELNEDRSMEKMLRSAAELGVFRISDHGIMTEELEVALERSDRMFGVMVEYCTSCGDHEKLIWSGDGHQISVEASALIGAQNFQILREEMKKVSKQLEAIGEALARAISEEKRCRDREANAIQVGESMLTIYRYHRANIVDRISSATQQTNNEADDSYALSLHLILGPGEICLDGVNSTASFHVRENNIVVTLGKQLEKWSIKSTSQGGKVVVLKPFLHSNRPSFSIEHKWRFADIELLSQSANKIISISDQIFLLLIVTLLYNLFAYTLMKMK